MKHILLPLSLLIASVQTECMFRLGKLALGKIGLAGGISTAALYAGMKKSSCEAKPSMELPYINPCFNEIYKNSLQEVLDDANVTELKLDVLNRVGSIPIVMDPQLEKTLKQAQFKIVRDSKLNAYERCLVNKYPCKPIVSLREEELANNNPQLDGNGCIKLSLRRAGKNGSELVFTEQTLHLPFSDKEKFPKCSVSWIDHKKEHQDYCDAIRLIKTAEDTARMLENKLVE